MQQHKIKVERTAHYHSLGKLDVQTQEIWVVCHGYGQLAEFFIKKFKALDAKHRYIVAPEGFNKFYLKGFDGRVGSSWMTKHQREDEITDYCNFLETLTHKILKQAAPYCQVKVLGFSQGSATTSRWLLRTKISVKSFFIWGGKLANDFTIKGYQNVHPNTQNFIVFGHEDEFYNRESIEKYKKELVNFNAQWIIYSGGHTIDEQTLLKISQL